MNAPKTPRSSLRRSVPPEVLAPVGGWTQLQAAIENGADAVYFGLNHFNARARAINFQTEDLPELMGKLHERGMQGFVTFNTLIFNEELRAAEEMLRAVVDAGVDALIVQDLGAVNLIRSISPDMPIHGSTQMTITSAEGAEMIGSMGVERIVLAREMSIKEIEWVAKNTDIELEVFVHGALCVSYSGQCFSSEAWGGRSANRGQCAQACRLPYAMLVDGKLRDLDGLRYLLSPQDLMGVDQVEALIEAGVSCLKIEGRLKGPEYVALATRAYRKAVDEAWARRQSTITDEDRRELTQIFSRGMTPGFLEGVQHQTLVEGRAPRHRGVKLGSVERVTRQGVHLKLEAPVQRGDGLVFDAGKPEDREEGGKLYEIFRGRRPLTEAEDGTRVELRFGPGVNLKNVREGDLVWKNRDERLEQRAQRTYEKDNAFKTPLSAHLSGSAGEPLSLVLTDKLGNEAHAHTEAPLQEARNRGLDTDQLRKFMGRLGQTPFALDNLTHSLQGSLFLPTSALNALRRDAVARLTETRRHKNTWTLHENEVLPGMLGSILQQEPHVDPLQNPQVTVLCRTMEQVEACMDLDGVEEVYVDFLDVKGLGDAIKRLQSAGKRAIAVSPRILKAKEERIWRFLLKIEPDAILVRSPGLLRTLTQLSSEDVPSLYGDFSLNATNHLTAKVLFEEGLARLSPNHDLNADQLCALARSPFAPKLELILHHHLPIFHTEHCVFCRFLSTGNSYKDCGRPCEEHQVHLKDQKGLEHIVQADMGCRNTVFNAEVQTGARHIPEFLDAGYRLFRVELLEQSPNEVAPLIQHYQNALLGHLQPPQLWRWLDQDAPQGVTLGSLVVSSTRRTMKAPARS